MQRELKATVLLDKHSSHLIMHHSLGGNPEASQMIGIDPEMAAKTHLDNVLQCDDRRMVGLCRGYATPQKLGLCLNSSG